MKAVNSLQVAITNSPLNEGKKRFFKLLAGSYDEKATRAKIQGLIDEHPKAREILTEKGAKYHTVEINKIPDGKAIKAELGMITGRTIVPSIWIGGQCIGGCNDGSPGLIPLLESGQLEPRLREVGAL